MANSIISGNPTFTKETPIGEPFINVAEFFCDTIQGENFVGWPSTFLRLQSCTMACIWCDTQEVWRFGNPYSYNELFDLMEQFELPRKFKEGQHLVLTGGSPLLQQYKLIGLINDFIFRYGFKPFIEIENECTLIPHKDMIGLVDLWNNSPKLKGSGNADFIRYQPHILTKLSSLNNSWFKFVIAGEEQEWEQIQTMFLDTNLIRKDQVVLMPLGATRAELVSHREIVLDMAIKHNVRYTTREHTIIWDKKTGV